MTAQSSISLSVSFLRTPFEHMRSGFTTSTEYHYCQDKCLITHGGWLSLLDLHPLFSCGLDLGYSASRSREISSSCASIPLRSYYDRWEHVSRSIWPPLPQQKDTSVYPTSRPASTRFRILGKDKLRLEFGKEARYLPKRTAC